MKTIAAISTGMTAAGLSVIRVSGEEAIRIADRVFRRTKDLSDGGGHFLGKQKSHTVHHGYLVSEGRIIDEVLVTVFRSPHSYTGEDTVEISCHGGLYVTREALSAVLSAGAVMAEPGEFSKRAFLNGRLDLTQAESVIEIIRAGNERALSAGIRGLSGEVSERIRGLRDRLLDEMAYIEAAIDDPEHYDIDSHRDLLDENIEFMIFEMKEILRLSKEGECLRNGIRTVLLGRPNVGKSSVLNLLSGREKAIVTDIPGTTRDVLEVPVRLGSLTLLLNDTAGLRETDEPIERIGVERALREAGEADLLLYLLDDTEGLTEPDREKLAELPKEKTIVLLNKTDLRDGQPADTEFAAGGFTVIPFSAKTGEGRELLAEEIEKRFLTEAIDGNDEVLLTSERARNLLSEALRSIEKAAEGLTAGVSEEFLTIDLLDAYQSLGEIIGEAVSDDVVDRVFEKFCMGK